MKQQEKQTWIDETLGSLDGIPRAEAPADLYEKARQRMDKGRAKIVKMPTLKAWSVAACLLLLVFANVLACLKYANTQHAQKSGIDSFANEYFAFAKPPQI